MNPEPFSIMTAQTELKNTADISPDELAHLRDHLATFERFVRRRFDEISMEINATSQLVDMAGDETSKRFSEILDLIHAIAAPGGDGLSPVNAGVELEAVIQMTEKAANRILDAADRIATKLQVELQKPGHEDLIELNDEIQEILLACTFQDLTSQRIRKTLENLQTIEDRLSNTLERLGVDITPPEKTHVETLRDQATSQDDIDKLFS